VGPRHRGQKIEGKQNMQPSAQIPPPNGIELNEIEDRIQVRSPRSTVQRSELVSPKSEFAALDFSGNREDQVTHVTTTPVAQNVFSMIFSESPERMWLDAKGNHVSITSGMSGQTIRVVSNQNGTPQLSDSIQLDEASRGIVVSPKGTEFAIIDGRGEIVTEYSVTQSGRIKPTFTYAAHPGSEITGCRYRGDDLVVGMSSDKE
jgi:hypothetical protein